MIPAPWTPLILVGLPLAGVIVCLGRLRPAVLLRVPLLSGGLALGLCLALAWALRSGATIVSAGGTLFIDPLSALHLCLVSLVFFLSSLYGVWYFEHELGTGRLPARGVRRFCMLWQGFAAVMMLVLTANNMGLMWVALEGTTLVSAFLILTDGHRASIEAMWKYLMVCSVGILFAFVGTLLLSVAARGAGSGPDASIQWTWLRANAGLLDPRIMLAAFIFALVGYGTKAGLAPMHTWLPDAHSQAPTPVSAVFSGVMLNCALYCIMRYLPIAEGALGFDGQARQLVLVFGLVSMVVAAVFIPAQTDIKRLLAYHSVEHMGIIAVGLGLGGLGTFAALFHTFNHSLSKTLAFFSAGRLVQQFGTRDMRDMRAAIRLNPVWGSGFFIAVLILIGVAPFAVFLSEFQILTAAVNDGRYVSVAVFLLAAVVIFVSALRHAMDVAMGRADASAAPLRTGRGEAAMVVVLCGLLLLLGVWMPGPLITALAQAAGAIGGLP